MQITFNIPDEKVQRVVGAIVELFPVPKDSNGDPLFTDTQWAKERIRRFIVDLVYRYERQEAQASIERDDNLVS